MPKSKNTIKVQKKVPSDKVATDSQTKNPQVMPKVGFPKRDIYKGK